MEQRCNNCMHFDDSAGETVVLAKQAITIGECTNSDCLWHGLKRHSIEGSVCPDWEQLPEVDLDVV